MTYYGNTTRPDEYDKFIDKWSRIRSAMPKRIYMLMYMIDGVDNTTPWVKFYQERSGGSGRMLLNSHGGIGFDAVVRRMVRDGEVTIIRRKGHQGSLAGMIGAHYTINRTYAEVTDHGRSVYEKWKRKNGKKFDLI